MLAGMFASRVVVPPVDVSLQDVFSTIRSAANIARSADGRTVTQGGSGLTTGGLSLSTSAKSEGKYYVEFEVAATVGTVGHSLAAGLHNGVDSLATYLGETAGAYGSWAEAINGSSRSTYNNNVQTTTVVSRPTPSIGDRIRMAVDFDAGKLWLSYWGDTSWVGGGDPVAGTSPTYTFTANTPMHFAANPRNTNNAIRIVLPSAWANPVSGFEVWDDPTALYDEYWDDVLALLHLDGPVGTVASIVDAKGNAWEVSGTPSYSDVAGTMIAGTSVYAAGSARILSEVLPGFGTRDFTIELSFWRTEDLSPHRSILYGMTDGAAVLGAYAAKQLTYWRNNAGGLNALGLQIPYAVRGHLAICRRDGVVRGFVGGVKAPNEVADTANHPDTRWSTGFISSDYAEAGYFDEIRITDGVARYWDNFDPPVHPFANV